MKPIAVAVVCSGLVSSETLSEIRRWGLPIDFVEPDRVISNPRQIADLIQNALEGEDQVKISETDLDVLTRFLDPKHQREGTLVVRSGDQKSTSKVLYCVTPLGEFAIPWVSESISDLMTNGQTYLRFKTCEGENEHVKFIDVREVFFGDRKAFMVCAPATGGSK